MTKGSSKSQSNRLEDLADSPRAFTTVSGVPVRELYTASDLAGFDYDKDLGNPGEYPFTRGIHSEMYRRKLWTMRQLL